MIRSTIQTKTLRKWHVRTTVGCLVVMVTLAILLQQSGPATLLSSQRQLDTSSLSGMSVWDKVQPSHCSPTTRIFFLKNHKCASSTVQNIFLIYGYKNNLTFALPASGNILGIYGPFQTDMLGEGLVPPGGKVDLFVLHTRLYPEGQNVVLHNDTTWITILREPTAVYDSLFHYFDMDKIYKMQLSEYSSNPLQKLLALPRAHGIVGKNQMLYDLGFPDNISVVELRHAIEYLDQRFHLVMIAELMDESLILLRHLLCWTLHDVVVFNKNARQQEVKHPLDPGTVKVLREVNSADVILYDYFLAHHREAVYKFGEQRMAEEVSALRSLRKKYYEDCGAREVNGRDSSLRYKEISSLVSSYLINSTDINCQMLTMPEMVLINTVRMNQKLLLKMLS